MIEINKKTPIFLRFEIYPKCMKHENNWKMKGKRVLPALEDKNLWKFLRENEKNLALNLDRSRRKRKAFEKFEKMLNSWKAYDFKKTLWTIFDWSKNIFDRSRTNRARQIQNKFLIAILIGRETGSIIWKSRKKQIFEK